LESSKATKEATQKRINLLNDELQKLFGKIPKKPKESLAELTEKIDKLEFKRTTTSWTLPEERLILKDIHTIQKQKLMVEEYNAYEQKVKDKKAELATLRDSLKILVVELDEIESTIQKVNLATKLHCAPSDLTTHTMECQSDKIGRVIGRQGATIKMLEQQYHVSMDVDSVAAKIHLTGSADAITAAVVEIENIINSVDVDVTMEKHVLGYLTSKRINAMADLRKAHPKVTMDVIHDKKHVQLRGLSQDVMAAKVALLMLDLVSKTRQLVRKEYSIVVGKAGVTINKFVDDHQVAIHVEDISDDEWIATITGPPANVNLCLQDIEQVLALNKEVVESLVVDNISRNILLSDSGAPIKKLQADINEKVKSLGIGGMVHITFDKEHTTEHKDVVLVKGRASAVAVAKEMIQATISQMKNAVVVISIDPFIVPRIIGKGGETIKKLKNGKAVNIEVDKEAGTIMIQSQNAAEIQRVETEINDIVKENQLERIDFQPTVVRAMVREISRSEHKTKLADLVWMGVDDETDQIVLRGTREQLDEAICIVNDFISKHYIQEIDISAEDEPTLVFGGADSTITKLASELGVELFMNKARYVLTVKGEKAKVKTAVKRLNQFLYGGEGHTVSRISVSEQALGVVIGKGGSKRSELEKKYEGVSLFIHKSNRITIRGPEMGVEACRIDVLKLVSSAKVTQLLPITPEQHAILSKPDVIRNATTGIPVIVTLTDDAVKIRGFFPDVRDAQAILKEPIFGFYEARVELDPSQLACVKGACRNPDHFRRMEELTNAKVILDLPMNAIVVTGTRADVRKAKSLVIEFIDFLLPADFAHLKISKPLYSTVGDASVLADIAAVSGATVTLDRDTSSIEVQSSDSGKVKKAADLLKARIAEAEKLAFVITLDSSEAWLIPLIIGKGGNRVNAFRMESNCQIDVNKEDRTLTVTGDSEDDVVKAKQTLNEIIDSARRECVFVQLPVSSIASFVGRNGAHIKSFSSNNKVEIERMRNEPSTFKITGDEVNIQAAKNAIIAWISTWEEQSAETSISINKGDISAIIGKGGKNISGIQKEYSCKIEINRDDMTLTVRGGSDELREKAIAKIIEIITTKAEPEMTEPQPTKVNKANGSIGAFDNRKDRSSEFAAHPVGLTVEEKPKKKSIRNKTKPPEQVSNKSTLQ